MIFFVPGVIPSKKNSKRIVHCKGRPMIISSSDYIKWEKKAVRLFEIDKVNQKPIGEVVSVYISFKLPDNRRRDLTNMAEGILDAMVKAGVIKDDCWKYVRHITLVWTDIGDAGASISVESYGV